MNYDERYEETLEYIKQIVVEIANPERIENNLELYVNDYVRDTYEDMTEEEQDKLIDDVAKQYFLLK